MRRQVAWWLVANLALPTGAAAQGGRDRVPVTKPVSTAGQEAPTVPVQGVSCGGAYELLWVEASEWAVRSEADKFAACQAAIATGQVVPLPFVPETRARSEKLAWAGGVVAFVGMSIAFNFGEDDVHVLGNTYCVSDYGDVAYGSCGSPQQTKIGLIIMSTGALLAFIGLKQVTVSPSITPTSKAVSATIRWGGKK